eukprot:Gb_17895 [translate_table: standard]
MYSYAIYYTEQERHREDIYIRYTLHSYHTQMLQYQRAAYTHSLYIASSKQLNKAGYEAVHVVVSVCPPPLIVLQKRCKFSDRGRKVERGQKSGIE